MRRGVTVRASVTSCGVLLLLVAAGACGEGGVGRDPAAERDSAGTTIVESSPPYARWAVDPVARVRIGAVSGEPEYQLSGVVFAGRLSDGGIVLVDGGSSEVRWYDAGGRFQARAGGPGEGPGELRRVMGAVLSPEDTLVLYDSRNQRLTWFGPGGPAARTRRLELGPGSWKGLHAMRGGGLLVVEEQHALNLGGREYNPTRDSMLVLLASNEGDAVDTVIHVPGREATTWVDYADGRAVGMRQMAVPFGQRALAGGAANRVAVVRSGQHALTLLDEGGHPTRLARRSDLDPPEVSEAMRDEYVADYAASGWQRGLLPARAAAAARERLSLLPEGRTVPAFDLLLTDAVAEQVWLRDFLPEGKEDEARTWTIHDLAGRVVAQLEVPAGFRLTHIRSGHLVGVETDALGVEYVVVYSVDA